MHKQLHKSLYGNYPFFRISKLFYFWMFLHLEIWKNNSQIETRKYICQAIVIELEQCALEWFEFSKCQSTTLVTYRNWVQFLFHVSCQLCNIYNHATMIWLSPLLISPILCVFSHLQQLYFFFKNIYRTPWVLTIVTSASTMILSLRINPCNRTNSC